MAPLREQNCDYKEQRPKGCAQPSAIVRRLEKDDRPEEIDNSGDDPACHFKCSF
jgi:hypothetical protein